MAPKLVVLVVTKDVAEFLLYQPVVALLRAEGYSVTVIAEGLSLGKWLALGESVYGGVPENTKVNQETGCRYDIEEHAVIDELVPDLVLTGLGVSINLGERFGLAANERGIKLGFVIDVWGAESRSSAVPDFICALDQFGRDKIKQHLLYQHRMPHIHITGSPAMDRLVSVEPDECVLTVAARYDLCVLLAGQDESTTPIINGLSEALDVLSAGGERFLLIPRLHPKFLAREDLQTLWLKALARVSCDVLWGSPKVSTAQLMCSAEITVSTYSNALLEAAALGSTPVSWVSDVGRAKMRQSLGGIERFPLVDCGCAIEVSTPEEFLAITPECRDQVREQCGKVYRNDGKNAERVVNVMKREFALS